MVTSRVEPKDCTCGSWYPAASTPARILSMLASFGKAASTLMPPVKSMAKFRPRVKNDAKLTIISTAESVYHTLRVAMNGKLVFL